MKAIKKSSHLKVIDRQFLLKLKKILQKKFIFGNIAVGKKQPATLEKNTFANTFHWKLTQKIVKLCRISQRTEAVNFILNQDTSMFSLKINDNVLLCRASNECEHDSHDISKVQPVNKKHAQSCKRNASKR